MSLLTNKILYIDCFSGISGDMMLGALLDLGVPMAVVKQSIDELGLPDIRVACERVVRGSLTANKWQLHEAHTSHDRSEHGHHHHVHYAEIRRNLTDKLQSSEVRDLALGMFDRIAVVEAKIHGVKLEQVSFHEVGAVDSIVDIVGIAAALHWLRPHEVVASMVPVGGGQVMTSHGLMPVPAPATLELLRGAPIAGGTAADGELVTPTGALVLASFVTRYAAIPQMRVVATGWGAGDRNPSHRSNVLRLLIGDAGSDSTGQQLVLIETNLDDMNPEFYEHIYDRLFQAGALDVWNQAVTMKKARPAQVVSVLCAESAQAALIAVLFSETTSLGVRTQTVNRIALERKFVQVQTPWGEVPVKLGLQGERIVNVAPEYEVCRRIAVEHGVPLKIVYDTVRKLV